MNRRYPSYDLCDTTACQVHRGMAAETIGGDAAVRATAGKILTYRGTVALTQRRRGPVAGLDPHDQGDRHRAALALGRHPAGLRVTSRDGAGAWGGRVRSIAIVGSRATVTVSGSTFQPRFGLRSRLFTVVGASPAVTPQDERDR